MLKANLASDNLKVENYFIDVQGRGKVPVILVSGQGYVEAQGDEGEPVRIFTVEAFQELVDLIHLYCEPSEGIKAQVKNFL